MLIEEKKKRSYHTVSFLLAEYLPNGFPFPHAPLPEKKKDKKNLCLAFFYSLLSSKRRPPPPYFIIIILFYFCFFFRKFDLMLIALIPSVFAVLDSRFGTIAWKQGKQKNNKNNRSLWRLDKRNPSPSVLERSSVSQYHLSPHHSTL